ncbi:MAG: TlpA family protein disulfide reductase [Cyanobacteria bacterium REEB65]|nr:TlpA family protein disulfide reductase [Cyanobacteria bacterium REEB65]
MSLQSDAPAKPAPGPFWAWLRQWWLVVLVASFVAWRLFTFFGGGSSDMAGRSPDFALPRIFGGTLSLSSLQGDVRIVDFWATWCGPCKMMTPVFADLYTRYHSKGLVVIGVALDDAKAVSTYAVEHQVPYPIVLGDRRTAERFGGIMGIPTTFILDRQGRVVSRHVGYRPEFVLEKEVLSLLNS